jgi:glucose-6-phosphate 1-epimerase
MTTLAEMSSRFSLPGTVTIVAGENGLPCIRITNRHAQAEVYLHAAHVTRFQPSGQQPVLWMSAKSLYQDNKPIRGGVPICFPWFGPHASDTTLPVHGFARSRAWNLVETSALHDGRTRVVLSLTSSEDTLRVWPHAFALRYTVTVGTTLELDLRVDNPGTAPFTYGEALHTYFTVGDVKHIAISGLSGTTYVDKMRQAQRFTDHGDITITAETDRVYLGTTATCVVSDPVMKRRLVIAKDGSHATVVWNPWIAKAKAMADFGDDEWPGMLCVETVNALDHAVTIPAGGSHHLVARIGVEPLNP